MATILGAAFAFFFILPLIQATIGTIMFLIGGAATLTVAAGEKVMQSVNKSPQIISQADASKPRYP